MKSIGQAEWRVMQYVADHHPVSVREVAEYMAEARGLARTSVLTVMERLRGKGHLKRKRKGRTWVYSPKVSKGELLQQVVQDFVETRLQGAVTPFLAYLAEKTDLTDGQVEELRAIVRDLDGKRAGKGASKGTTQK